MLDKTFSFFENVQSGNGYHLTLCIMWMHRRGGLGDISRRFVKGGCFPVETRLRSESLSLALRSRY